MNLHQISRMGLAWARGQVSVRYAPKQISIEPTNLCNYRCSFCPQSNPEHHLLPRGYMKLEHLERILDKVVAAGAAWNGVISFTHDGEPLLHPEFPEFIRLANERGLRPRFSSNGSRLGPEKADRLEAGGYFLASIDFSGSKEVFETHRGKTGHWETVRDNIAYLIEMSNRNPKVGLEVNEMCGVAEPEDAGPMLDRLRSVLPEPTSKRVRFGVRVFHNAAGSVVVEGVGREKQRYRRCPYPWVAMNIAFDGEVHACCRDLEGRTRLGNVLECESLWDVWNGEKFREFRHLIATRQPEKLAACAGCDLPWSGDPRKWSVANIYRVLRDR
jgi:MoaA/NifB/PqqE/SkfB family radical SAM enzyme